MSDKHFLAGHTHSFEGSAGLLAGEAGKPGGNQARGVCHHIGQLHLGRGFVSEFGKALQDLFECEILATKNIPLARLAFFSGQNMTLRDIARIDQIESGIDKGGHAAGKKIAQQSCRWAWASNRDRQWAR